jgi:dipeptidase E
MSAGVARLLSWPTALSGDLLRGAETWLRTSLRSRPPVEVTTWLDLSAHRGEDLGSFDLVFVGGGNTFDLRHRIQAAELGPALHRFVEDGGTYYGGSAGAIMAGESIGLAAGLDEDRIGDPDTSGLRLVPGVDVLPHFTPARVARIEEWSARHPGRLMIGVPEASGVWFRDHRAGEPGRRARQAHVLGPDPVDVYLGGHHHARYVADDDFAVG